ncbi:hypothetical protein K523DRAFT_282465 [Schizophyllum commune Tattone D]|nr:hypothetical protein K523DRAFT_282465 [Schizophyllum commune Tattone D]
MAGIHEMPTEILTKILLAALPTYWFRSRPFSRILAISQICRRWRAICLGTPCLWQRVSYVERKGADEWRDEDVAALREYLRRSAGQSLSITMGRYVVRYKNAMNPLVGELPQPCVRDLWALLFAESRRWRVARFVLDEDAPIIVPYDEPLDVPDLEEASVMCPGDINFRYPVQFNDDSAFRWFENAPKLRRLCVAEPFSASVMKVAWERLTHLDLSQSSEHYLTQYVAEILPRCTSLVHLVAESWSYGIGRVEGFPVVEMPTLRTLYLDGDAVVLSYYLHVPRLERFAYDMNTLNCPDRRRDAFLLFCERHALPDLRHLYLTSRFDNWRYINPMLERMPGITYLHIDYCQERLRLASMPRKLCAISAVASLRTLSLQMDKGEWNSPAIAALLVAELVKLPNLAKFEMWNVEGDSVFGDQRLEGLRARGVVIERHREYVLLPRDSDVVWG